MMVDQSREFACSRFTASFICLLLFSSLPAFGAEEPLQLGLRERVQDGAAADAEVVERSVRWDPAATAVIVCDVWDSHHCYRAVGRVNEMVPRMEQVISALRDRGVTVIHAPSGCMQHYADHPARLRAQAAPNSELPTAINSWCHSIAAEDQADYPIDQSEGGEDDTPAEHAAWAAELAQQGRDPEAPWQAQHPGLTINAETDFISDQGDEVWNILQSRGIENVILLGVHTNMCVLGRPFGLRQMVKNGKQTVLMRDMTDTMYDPKARPFVSHFQGTELIIAYIERYVCPTITSDQVIGGETFRFAGQ